VTVEALLFAVLALIAVASALGMLLSRNAVYSALFLIMNFATVAVFYLILSAPFIALVQVTVYAGAIMVLFLFVIMLLGAERTGRRETSRWVRPAAIILGSLLLVESTYVIFAYRGDPAAVKALAPSFGGAENIGEILFNRYLLPFEVTSILLLVAMVGAIVLTKHES